MTAFFSKISMSVSFNLYIICKQKKKKKIQIPTSSPTYLLHEKKNKKKAKEHKLCGKKKEMVTVNNGGRLINE